MKFKLHKILFILVFIILAGCSSEAERQKEHQIKLQGELVKQYQVTQAKLSSLKQQIDSGVVNNTNILRLYGQTVKRDQPDLSQLVDALTKDATSQGPTYQSLVLRLNDVKSGLSQAVVAGDVGVNQVSQEMMLIEEAASPSIYNMMLTDPINVLADMSQGRLARVEAMSKLAMESAMGSTDTQSGSQLVGNPNYGQWRQDSSGSQVWFWLAAYSLLNNSNRPVYYDRWSSGRHYSYYHDVGRRHYTSPSKYKQQQATINNTKRKFQKQGKTFTSPYAKTKVGASATTVKPKSIGRYNSSYASAKQRVSSNTKSSQVRNSNYNSSYSSSNKTMSSARNSYARTSRSTRRGK